MNQLEKKELIKQTYRLWKECRAAGSYSKADQIKGMLRKLKELGQKSETGV